MVYKRLTPKDWKNQYQIGVCSRDISAGECVVYNECFDYIQRLAEFEDKIENNELGNIKQALTEFSEYLKDYVGQVQDVGYEGIGKIDIDEKLKEFLANADIS